MNSKNLKKNKIILSIGISTYNRPEHILERVSDFKNLGYLNNPEVQIIIHDNNSDIKYHCIKIKNIQKLYKNLSFIRSPRNIGMAKGCYKILLRAKGEWITILGDDDPICMKSSKLKKILEKCSNHDHIYFTTKEFVAGKVVPLDWFPKIKIGTYTPSQICAKTGFTTCFAHLASHCFRKQNNMAKKWEASHKKTAFYGHCIMLIENYKKSFATGKTMAAWRSGNERISKSMQKFIALELHNLFSNPNSETLRKFLRLNPANVRKEGVFPLKNYVHHPFIEPILRYEKTTKNERIRLQHVNGLQFNPASNVFICPAAAENKKESSCVFVEKNSISPKSFGKSGIGFRCDPGAKNEDIGSIVRQMGLTGKIYMKGRPVSSLMLLAKHCDSVNKKALWKIKAYVIVFFSFLMYGFEDFNLSKIILNYFDRPQKNLYGVIHAFERTCRLTCKKVFFRDGASALKKNSPAIILRRNNRRISCQTS